MREPRPSLPSFDLRRLPGLVLVLVPTAVITAIMAAVLCAAPMLGATGKLALFDAAVLANIAVWFAFAPPYLVGWVHFWDPTIRARTGALGVVALAGVLWFLNLFAYALSGHVLATML